MQPTLRSSTILDRQSNLRGDAAYLAALSERADARFVILVDGAPVMQADAEGRAAAIRWLQAHEIAAFEAVGERYFLGVLPDSGAGRFAIAFASHRIARYPGATGLLDRVFDLRAMAMQGVVSSEDLSLLGMAKSLSHWHATHRCCSQCGARSRVKDGGWRRICWSCGRDHYPRTDPVVIMLVVDLSGDRCLLGRAPRFPEGMYSTLAGFVEPGEDIEDAVRRETHEETSVRVGAVHFHSAQPWPFPHTLMIGCVGFATTTDIEVDPVEIADARWFTREDCEAILDGRHPEGITGPGRQAIARVLVQSFVDGRV